MAETMTLPTLELPDIVQRYVNGESVQSLAREAGVARQTIYEWMFPGLGDAQYEQIVTKALIRRIADADQELDESAQPHDIARAREKMRFFRMDLERRRPKLYGQKTESHIDNKITITINRASTPQPVVTHDIENAEVIDT